MSIYHLHIPRTSGVFVREQIIKKTYGSMFVGHTVPLPQSFSNYEYVSGHYATNPIPDFDINFAIYRDPVELTFSYVNYMRDKLYPHLSFDELMKEYIDTDKIKNFVNINSRFLTGVMDVTKYNKMITNLRDVAENGWYVESSCKNLDSFVETIQNNRTILINYYDPQKYQKISSIYNVEYNDVKINESSEIYEESFIKYNNLITDLNSFDLEVYEYLSANS